MSREECEKSKHEGGTTTDSIRRFDSITLMLVLMNDV
jgi:hypothetical protein